MHLITGFVLANLFGRKKEPGRSPLLSLRHPIRTRHILPGRVRFETDALINDAKAEQFLMEQMSKVKGVSKVQISTITGSVLVQFEDNEIQPELLYTVLIRLLGLEKELERTPQSVVLKEIRLMGDSLNRSVLERTGGIMDGCTYCSGTGGNPQDYGAACPGVPSRIHHAVVGVSFTVS
jgi:hypothetical protein